DHGDLVSPYLGELVGGQTEQLAALELGRATDPGCLRQEAHSGERRHPPAGTRLTPDREDLAPPQLVGDTTGGLDDPVVGGELDGQILDGEELVCVRPGIRNHCQRRTICCLGSSASRRPSPMKLMVSTVMMTKNPGM